MAAVLTRRENVPGIFEIDAICRRAQTVRISGLPYVEKMAGVFAQSWVKQSSAYFLNLSLYAASRVLDALSERTWRTDTSTHSVTRGTQCRWTNTRWTRSLRPQYPHT